MVIIFHNGSCVFSFAIGGFSYFLVFSLPMIIWQIRRLAKKSEPCIFSLRVNTRCGNCIPTLDSCYLALFLNRGCMEIYVFLLQLKVTSSTNHGVTLHIGNAVIIFTANDARRTRQSSRKKEYLFRNKIDLAVCR